MVLIACIWLFGLSSIQGQPAAGTVVLAPSPSAGPDAAPPTPTTQRADMSRADEVQTWRYILLWTLVLFIIFVAAVGVIVRFSVRFKAYLFRGDRRPTADEDLWLQHKLPEGVEDKGSEPDAGDGDAPAPK